MVVASSGISEKLEMKYPDAGLGEIAQPAGFDMVLVAELKPFTAMLSMYRPLKELEFSKEPQWNAKTTSPVSDSGMFKDTFFHWDSVGTKWVFAPTIAVRNIEDVSPECKRTLLAGKRSR